MKRVAVLLAGLLTGAILFSCGTPAGNGTLRSGSWGLNINQRPVIEPGKGIDEEENIPSSVTYTDKEGNITVYMPIQTVAQLLDIPSRLDEKQNKVWLGDIPSSEYFDTDDSSIISTISDIFSDIFSDDEDIFESIDIEELRKQELEWADHLPLHRVGESVGLFTELEPYQPDPDEIGYYLEQTTTGRALFETRYWLPTSNENEYYSFSITNHSETPLVLYVTSISTITRDSFSPTIVPVGETVVRTFQFAPYTGTLREPDLAIDMRRKPGSDVLDISATVKLMGFIPDTDS